MQRTRCVGVSVCRVSGRVSCARAPGKRMTNDRDDTSYITLGRACRAPFVSLAWIIRTNENQSLVSVEHASCPSSHNRCHTMMTRRRSLLRRTYGLTLGLVAVSVVVPSYHRWMARYTPDRTFFVTQPQQVRPPSRPLPPPPQIVWLLSFPNSVRIRGCYTDACFANYWSASCSPSNNPL